MITFVHLWTYLSATPLFGLTATISVYVLAQAVYARFNQAPIANPVLWTILVLVLMLMISDTPYQTYFAGAQFIHFLLGPAIVALAWPLWQRRAVLRRNALPLLTAGFLGGATAAGTAVALGWLLGLPNDILMSLAPKSTTAPVAMGIAQQLGGVPALAAIFAVLTGLIGALSGKYLFDALGIRAPEIRGFAIGSISHGIGAARALQVHPDAGAYAGLGLGLQVILATLVLLVVRLVWP